jgi:HSP20 family protein
MIMLRWNPFGQSWLSQMQQLQGELNRVFDRWGDSGRFPAEAAQFPAINVWEEENSFTAEAELPGLDLKDIEIYVTGQNQLTIKGERRVAAPEKSVQHRQERGFGKFVRTLTLPSPVDENKVEARLENGLLLIRLPKHERAKPRKIAIKG